MTQYNSLNERLSNSQLNKLKSAIKNEAVLRISLGMVGNSNNNTNFSHKLLLTDRQIANIRKAFYNNLSTDVKFSKTQLSKMMQSGGFLGNLLSKLAGPLMKVAMPLAKNVLAPLELTAAMSAIDGSNKKKMLGSGATKGAGTTTLIISNNEMNDFIKIVKSLEDSGVLLKGVSETIKHEAKEQRGGFLSMLLGTLGASLLGNLLTGGKGVIRAGEGIKKKSNLQIPFHPLTNFEISEYYENDPRFNGVYSRDNLPENIKKGGHVINLDEYEDAGTHWIALYVKNKKVLYFDSFGVEHAPKEIIIFIKNKDIIANIFRSQAYDSIMCGYFCIKFIDYMFDDKTLIDYTNLFSPHDFKKNNNIIKDIIIDQNI